MPFGMKNSPATFQRLMNIVTAGVSDCVVYVDDIVVYSSAWETHLEQLCLLFSALRKAGLVVNLQKCQFAQSEVEYLGHIVGHGMVTPRDAKVTAIKDFPLPGSKRDVMRFLGMSGFYRQF